MNRLRAVLLAVILAGTAACGAVTPSAPQFPPSSSSEVATSTTDAPPETGQASPVDPPARGAGPLATEVAGAPALVGATCPTGWGSQPKTDPAMGTGEVSGVRVGRHPCFDRVVVDLDGPDSGYAAQYVDQVSADPSGQPVTVPGGGRIQFVVHHPRFSGPAAGTSVANVAGFDTLRSVVAAGSFEGVSTFGVGVRAKLPFRVFTTSGVHGRIILDVAHQG